MVKERNINLDIIRGIAAYSVVANHVLSHFTGFSESIIGNINFSLQNPLFMMVSGWALLYSKPIVDKGSFWTFVKKRTILLVLPWVIWSILKFALIGNKSFAEYFSYDLYHMEGLYWFLFSLWIMNMIYAISCLLFKSLIDNRIRYAFAVSAVSMLLVTFLFCGSLYTTGVDFLGIKFTTYYFPFFLMGWIGSEMTKKSWSDKNKSVFDYTVLVLMVLYAILIARFDVVSLPDIMAPLRFLISVAGCIVVFYAVLKSSFDNSNKIVKAFSWGGQKTLEIYVVHYIVMGFLKNSGTSILTVWGFSEFIIDLILVLLVTVLFIAIIDSNRYSRKILFGKF